MTDKKTLVRQVKTTILVMVEAAKKLDEQLDELDIDETVEWRLALNGLMEQERIDDVLMLLDEQDISLEDRMREYAKQLLHDYVVGRCGPQDFGIPYSPDMIWNEKSDDASRWALDAEGWWDLVPISAFEYEWQFVSLKDFMTRPKPYGWKGDKK